MNILRRLDDALKKTEAATACVVLVAIVLIGTAQIFFRFVLKSSLIWSEELMRYLFVWLAFITASIAVREHKHISVDFVTTYMPAKVNLVFYFISRIAMLAYFYFMIPAGIQLCIKTAHAKSTILPITWNFVYAALPVGMILMLFSMASVFSFDLKQLKENIRKEKKGGDRK